MLNTIRTFDGEREVTRTRFADADQKCTIVFIGQELFGVGCKKEFL